MSMQRFYYAADKSSVDQHLAGEHVLISAGSCYHSKRGKFSIPAYLDKAKSIILDSGCFTYRDKVEGRTVYPFTWQQYARFVVEFAKRYPQTEYFAVQDHFAGGLDTALQNRRFGVWELPGGCPAQPMMVIQGETIEDYLECIGETLWDEDYSETGGYYPGAWQHLTDEDNPDFDDTEVIYDPTAGKIGIGNLAARRNSREVLDILSAVRETLGPDAWIHAFGLKYRFFRDLEIRSLINSADSGIWRFAPGTAHRLPSNHAEKIANLESFKVKMGGLSRTGQPALSRCEPVQISIE